MPLLNDKKNCAIQYELLNQSFCIKILTKIYESHQYRLMIICIAYPNK